MQTLPNGLTLSVNGKFIATETLSALQLFTDLGPATSDHVFIAAPYEDRSGDPYNVRSCVKKLPDSPGLPPSGPFEKLTRAARQIGRVQEFFPESQEIRVNFFVRPRDIGSRMAMHGRRLLATMHSDLVPVHFVRGTCTVLHRDSIPHHDEDSYRREPDCFYFNQVPLLPLPLDISMVLT